MRKIPLGLLTISICLIASLTSNATNHQLSPGGSEITWATNYPKADKETAKTSPKLFVKYVVTPAGTWTPTKIEFEIHRYANSDGSGYNGKSAKSITSNFSEEYWYNVNEAGKSARVKEIYLTIESGGNSEQATEQDSGLLQIRD